MPAASTESAEALFQRGIEALKGGHFEVACNALEQSLAREAAPGTLLALGDCFERWQKLASASARYSEFIEAMSHASGAESAYRAEQLQFARAGVLRLEPSIPRLRLSSPMPLPTDLRVLLDGQVLEREELEQPIALDPGRHVLETQATGHTPHRVELELQSGQQQSLELELGPVLPLAPESAPAPHIDPPSPSAGRGAVATEPEARTSAWRPLGWGLGALGVAGLGVGAVAGTLLLQTCPGLDCADHEARGKRLALITDISVGVGIGALVSSVIVLINTEPAVPPRDIATHWSATGAVLADGVWLGMNHPF